MVSTPVIEDIQIRNINADIMDEDGDYPSSFDLYNNSSIPVNLHYWSLTNNPAIPDKWLLPNVTLQPDESIRVFASGKNRPGSPDSQVPYELHSNFTFNLDEIFLSLSKSIPNNSKDSVEKMSLKGLLGTVSALAILTTVGIIYWNNDHIYDWHNWNYVIQGNDDVISIDDYDDILSDISDLHNPNTKFALLVTGPLEERYIDRSMLLTNTKLSLERLGYKIIHLCPGNDNEVKYFLRPENKINIKAFVFIGHGNSSGLRVAGGNLTGNYDRLTMIEVYESIHEYDINTGVYTGLKKELDFVMINACAAWDQDGRFYGTHFYDDNIGKWGRAFNTKRIFAWGIEDLHYLVYIQFEKRFWETFDTTYNQYNSFEEIDADSYSMSYVDVMNNAWIKVLEDATAMSDEIELYNPVSRMEGYRLSGPTGEEAWWEIYFLEGPF